MKTLENYPNNLKYPFKDYINLVEVLSQLKGILNLNTNHITNIHYLAYQQTAKGQNHNWLYKKGEDIQPRHKIEFIEGWTKVVNVNFELSLYPGQCNDNHIETATKRAIKELL